MKSSINEDRDNHTYINHDTNSLPTALLYLNLCCLMLRSRSVCKVHIVGIYVNNNIPVLVFNFNFHLYETIGCVYDVCVLEIKDVSHGKVPFVGSEVVLNSYLSIQS